MLMSEAFPSAYIKAPDLFNLPNKEIEVEIESCERESLGQGDSAELLPVVRFKGKNAGLVLNKTNSNVLVASFGNDSAEWIGRKCILYATTTTFKGELTDCIRVRAPQQNEEKPPAAQPEVVRVEDDDVPF